ncbi:MAG: hypothetical protein DME20_05645 [Verrucomicrobia bacterium]|nr:MAG: hypothetical protein DME20_05645 [Verrucomicrobiota bacterium]TMB73853.1 MAG: sulfotransferase [Deltaproteobacteria bacterium]
MRLEIYSSNWDMKGTMIGLANEKLSTGVAGGTISVPPVFIVGVPRSGTTLLVNLLGHHPILAPIYETRFLRNLLLLCEWCCWFYGNSLSRKSAKIFAEAWVRWRFQKVREKYRSKAIAYNIIPAEGDGTKQSYESFPFGESHCIAYTMEELIRETDAWFDSLPKNDVTCETFYSSARGYVDRLFSIHCARMKKPHWVNKTPGLLTYTDLLAKLYPGSRCIHILRDGRDVAMSNISLGWGPRTVRAAARRWKSLIQRGRQGARSAQLSYTELLYEDLVRSPREALKRITRFLTIEDCLDEILSQFKVSKERTEVWRSRFSQAERRVFAQEAGDLLVELGYETDYSWVER